MPTASKTKSPSLPELQRWMRGVLTHPRGVNAALRKKEGPRFLHVIGETPELNRADRLSIYGDGYFWRLIDCLGANYEATQNILPHEVFHKLAHDYLVRYPSRYKCIDDVGRELPDFIKTHAAAKGRPYLADLAALEWAVHQSMYANDVAPLNPKKLSALPAHKWAGLTLTLDPSVRLLKLAWPVDELWRADGKWSAAKIKRLRKKTVFLLVYRRDDKLVRAPRLTQVQYQLLNSLHTGATLAESLARLPEKNAAASIKQWFNDWVSRGVIRDIS